MVEELFLPVIQMVATAKPTFATIEQAAVVQVVADSTAIRGSVLSEAETATPSW